MKRKSLSAISRVLVAAVVVLVLVSGSLAITSGKEYKFRSVASGENPNGGLVSDGDGNFYGVTFYGGLTNCNQYVPSCGAVFKLTLGQNGGWSESLIYKFKGGTDGIEPSGTLVFDTAGNLYGTDRGGGSGEVFELSPNQNGKWTKSVPYTFQGGADGDLPAWGVIFDPAGNLYGTTSNGGNCNTYCGGTVFKLTPLQGGGWSKSTLYSFPSGVDGDVSPSGLAFDSAGNLYGTTLAGGPTAWGTVFQLTPNQDGSWTEADLYTFTDGLDGGYPYGPVTFDGAGNLYGEASRGGSFACPVTGCGVVFELTPKSGTWNFTVAYTFNGLNGSKGDTPTGGLVFDHAGNLYGTTDEGGDASCNQGYGCGTIFKLSPKSGGGFTFRMLGAFNGTDGWNPLYGVIVDALGNIYGTAYEGGDLNCGPPYGCGAVFTITP
jgi:uncharacterized repeat protein (TIGR03803 family)